jgi:hypothetical protein
MMNLQMRMAVRSVAKQFPTAIVSGRCRDKVLHPIEAQANLIIYVTEH